jgi:phage tail sheath protein FI
MAVQVSYPGVYIDEFAPGAPITGVGTSTAAFIGVCARGPLDEPTRVTSWDQFKQVFGDEPLPGFYLWYSVRGFFENGGTVCLIVRASNGTYGELLLENEGGSEAYRVRARQPGAIAMTIAVVRHHVLEAAQTSLYQPTATVAAQAGRDFTVGAEGMVSAEDVAARFRPGDVITVAAGGESLEVARVTGAVLRVAGDPQDAYSAGDPVRLADTAPGERTFRIAYGPGAVPSQSLLAGTVLTFAQGGNSATGVVESVRTEFLPGNQITYRVTLRAGLGMALTMDTPATVRSEELDLTVAAGASTTYANLSLDAAHPRYYRSVVNGDPDGPVTIAPLEPSPPEALPDSYPAALAPTPIDVGDPEDLTGLLDQDFVDALDTLVGVDDVNLIACPDRITNTVQQAIITHCELLADRFAVLDAAAGAPPFGSGSVEVQRQAVVSTRGYAGLYYPWLRVPPRGPGEPILAPPSGHVCGIVARSDASRGVHKAPANEIVRGSLGVERVLSDVDQGQLNLQGINVVRVFGGGRPVLWGARTTASDANWQYVSTRRLFLFMEESIAEGIRGAVFEPNNLQLWKRLKRTISEFCARVWKDGGLFGATPEEAFYVRIDEELNPFSEQALGRLHIEIGLRPTYPAEFIVVRIGIWPGGAQISE